MPGAVKIEFLMKRLTILALYFTFLAACNPVKNGLPAGLTATPTMLPTSTSLPTQTAPPTPSTPSPSITPTPTLPAVSIIKDIVAYRQDRPLDCEARAAVDWAAYFGVQISEYDFQFKLPVSDNPDMGFVGTSDSLWGQTPPFAYGVHAGPVADLLKEYGLQAVARKGMPLDELKRQIYQGHPVIAWVIGNCEGGVPAEYVDSKGNKTIVAAYEHVIIVIGYTEENLRYYSSGKLYEVPFAVFLNSWKVLENMAVVWEE